MPTADGLGRERLTPGRCCHVGSDSLNLQGRTAVTMAAVLSEFIVVNINRESF